MVVSVFFINLARRADRRLWMEAELEQRGIHAQRVEAIDAQALPITADLRFLNPAEEACWLSHRKTLEIIAAGSTEIALVLEDDACFDDDLDLLSLLDTLPEVFRNHDLDLLQIGYIASRYRLKLSPTRFAEKYVLLRQRYRVVDSAVGKIRMCEFRSGAHAYAVTRDAARRLAQLNVPVALPTDDFLQHLAELQDGRNGFRPARLVRSRVGQRTRVGGQQAIDSDIG